MGMAATGLSLELVGLTSWGSDCADPSYPGTVIRQSLNQWDSDMNKEYLMQH